MSMQVVYGLIHAAHQLQSQLGLPILKPTITWTCHVCYAGGQTAVSAVSAVKAVSAVSE